MPLTFLYLKIMSYTTRCWKLNSSKDWLGVIIISQKLLKKYIYSLDIWKIWRFLQNPAIIL